MNLHPEVISYERTSIYSIIIQNYLILYKKPPLSAGEPGII